MNLKRFRPAATAVTLATLGVLTLAACGDNGGKSSAATPASSRTQSEGTPAAQGTPAQPSAQDTTLPSERKAIARTQGDKGIVGEIYKVERKDGILTVWAGARNTGTENYMASSWKNGTDVYTLAGSSIVDRKNSKRFMALLDSSGNCLCSERLGDSIEPGETRPLYAQFQAPPQSVTEVDLQLGTMQVVTIPAG
ncbi:hypothetical protein ACIO6T_38095 [Streptomyces sp. NPDC087532]|uniref:hypothetical protein n=1 Tax=Streptomyces sp. NPDC087532 TaxID=3365795 RepID=UPI00381EB341